MAAEVRLTTFTSLYHTTVTPLRRYLARMLRNHSDAEDLAHDAYLRVYEAMDDKAVARPEAFLFTTARRLALNHIKRRRIAPVDSGDGAKIIEFTATGAPGVERIVIARQEWARMEAALNALPAGCRAVLLLRQDEHLSHEEIGQRLGINVSTVEKQQARALRLLRAALKEEEAVNTKRPAVGRRTAGGG